MEDLASLSNDELSIRLKQAGLKCGPITSGTRALYEKKLCNQNNNGSNDQKYGSLNEVNENEENNSEISSPQTCQNSDNVLQDSVDGKKVFYGVCRDSQENNSIKQESFPLVFGSHQDAIGEMKNWKGSRMKRFSTRNEAEVFSLSKMAQDDSTTKAIEPSIPYKTPTPQELDNLMGAVKAGNCEIVKNKLRQNPKYLVTSAEAPVMLHLGSKYNIMHVAAKENRVEICKLVVSMLEDDNFWSLMFPEESNPDANKKRSHRMLDCYVNTPDKAAGDTPLRIACRFGFTEVVRFLVSLPCVEKGKGKSFNETLQQNKHIGKGFAEVIDLSQVQVICLRCKVNQDETKKQIEDLLSEKVYVQLLRAEDDSKDPVLRSSADGPITKTSSPLEPKFCVKASAGPMSPEQASRLLAKWKSPNRENFLNDFEKGKERRGRHLAHSLGVSWTEYWPFLEQHADFSSKSGLKQLENYLKKKFATRKSASESSFNQRCRIFGTFRGNFSNQSDKDSEDGNEPQSPESDLGDSVAKNLLDDFNGGSGNDDLGDMTKEPIANNMFALSSPAADVGSLSATLSEMSLNRRALLNEANKPPASSDVCHLDDPELNSAKKSSETQHGELNGGHDISSVFGKSIPDVGEFPKPGSEHYSSEMCRPLFISGDRPSKSDFDVFNVIEEVDLDDREFPFICQWKRTIYNYPKLDRCSWPSPYSPRYRSRLAKTSSLGSSLQK